MRSPIRPATFLAAQLSLAMALPLMAAAADAPNGADSRPANPAPPTQSATSPDDPTGLNDPTRPGMSGAGPYDQYDRFKDKRGFPLPGYSHVIEPN